MLVECIAYCAEFCYSHSSFRRACRCSYCSRIPCSRAHPRKVSSTQAVSGVALCVYIALIPHLKISYAPSDGHGAFAMYWKRKRQMVEEKRTWWSVVKRGLITIYIAHLNAQCDIRAQSWQAALLEKYCWKHKKHENSKAFDFQEDMRETAIIL